VAALLEDSVNPVGTATADLRRGAGGDAGGLVFDSSSDALAWLEAERANLLAVRVTRRLGDRTRETQS
jgi:hypothetical protein